ncbi:MAG TPA: M48 family metalloprotease [Thermoanaerobaculia bacterium]
MGSSLVLGVLAISCSANPATGRRQLNLYSEVEEIEIGRTADREILGQLGVVDDPELQGWVSEIGLRLAARSERPGLPWSFKVVDDPVVNAFALPGGFVYVTRGILAHLSSEAELAAVVGHEIGHVTAQHGVNQMSKAQLATGGLALGMILAPGAAQSAGQLAQAGLGLLFLKYGRDDERQADDLGLRYMVQGGFESREMPKVFEVLRQVGESGGGDGIPNWLSSHPDPGARRERAERSIAERGDPPGEVGGSAYLRRIDGIAFGADPRDGYFEGTTFFQPALALRLDFPAGWSASNAASRVVAVHPERVAQLELTLAKEKSTEEAARAFLAQKGLEAGASRQLRTNGLAAVQADFAVPRENAGRIVGGVVFFELESRVFRLLALALEDQAPAVRQPMQAFLSGFERLTDRRRIDVAPRRIRVEALDRPASLRQLHGRWRSDAALELLALVNAVDDPDRLLAAGSLVKRIEGREVGSQRIGPDLR